MSTFQLAQVLTKDPVTKESFAGVYACNQLSSVKINKYPKLFVVNTGPMEFPGTHWIAIYFNEQMKGEFFDSYGKHPLYQCSIYYIIILFPFIILLLYFIILLLFY